MTEVDNTLNNILFSNNNLFVVPVHIHRKTLKASNAHYEMLSTVLCTLNDLGYSINNADLLQHLSGAELKYFLNDFINTIKFHVKEGVVFRSSFLKYDETTGLAQYTNEERAAILSQYVLTYGDQSNLETQCAAGGTLSAYISTLSNQQISLTDLYNSSRDNKVITLTTFNSPEIYKVVRGLAESKKVLTAEEITILKSISKTIIDTIIKDPSINFRINEIKILFSALSSSLHLLSNSTDILKYVVYKYADTNVNEPIEGQLLVSDLANHRIKISTSARKKIMLHINAMAIAMSPHSLTEDMYKFPAYWKIIDRKLRWESSKKTRLRYPHYAKTIDLLYENDRSWTFNGRYSNAEKANDFNVAINIAAERPGFLLRNLTNLIRYKTGDTIAMKQEVFDNLTETHEAFILPAAQSDAEKFLRSEKFVNILNSSNTKLLFQLREELFSPTNNTSTHDRIVQGVEVNYAIAIPAINKSHRNIVLNHITKVLKVQLSKHNNTRKIFIEPEVLNYPLSYSGRESLTTSYTGQYVPPRYTFDMKELKDDIILRLGILWRSDKRSMDLDHNVSIYRGNINDTKNHKDVMYNSPELRSSGKIIAVSSGDITECGGLNDDFSVEFVDLDIKALKQAGYSGLFNSLINFSGGNINDAECYATMEILPKRQLSRLSRNNRDINKIKMNLNQTDYAIKLDEPANAYLGLHINLLNDQVTIMSVPVQSQRASNNSISLKNAFIKHISNITPPTTLEGAFSHIGTFTNNKSEADIIIDQNTVNNSFGTIEQMLFIN